MKMRNLRIMVCLFLIPLMAFGIHKYYISLTKVDYIEEKQVIQITMRYFLDDIELALENSTGEVMKLSTKNEHKNANQYLETYIRQKFSIWINEKEVIYNYLGKEYENDEVFFYLELENIKEVNSIAVQNSMLIDTYEEQQNFVKVNVKNIQKTFILVKANDKDMLKL